LHSQRLVLPLLVQVLALRPEQSLPVQQVLVPVLFLLVLSKRLNSYTTDLLPQSLTIGAS
jgi:hypothetical protein